eukprot:m.32882 g.32882  ORF g.32882 m.32882 type:complete len:61 (-) comp10836_c0_seq1:85-267(-)
MLKQERIKINRFTFSKKSDATNRHNIMLKTKINCKKKCTQTIKKQTEAAKEKQQKKYSWP